MSSGTCTAWRGLLRCSTAYYIAGKNLHCLSTPHQSHPALSTAATQEESTTGMHQSLAAVGHQCNQIMRVRGLALTVVSCCAGGEQHGHAPESGWRGTAVQSQWHPAAGGHRVLPGRRAPVRRCLGHRRDLLRLPEVPCRAARCEASCAAPPLTSSGAFTMLRFGCNAAAL